MDVFFKVKEDIWDKVCEFFFNFEVLYVRNVDIVIFFIFGKYLIYIIMIKFCDL